MSDVLFGTDTGEEELDAILDEVRGGKEKPADEEPARTWSMDDIDRLIADSNGTRNAGCIFRRSSRSGRSGNLL